MFVSARPPERLLFRELDFHWLQVNQAGFEANGHHISVPRIELHLIPSTLLSVSFLGDGVL